MGLAFVIELEFLHGRERLEGYDVFSLIKYSNRPARRHRNRRTFGPRVRLADTESDAHV